MIAFRNILRHNIPAGAKWGRRARVTDEKRAPVLKKGDEAMAGRREDVDLDLVLLDPAQARHYIAHFNWDLPGPPKYVVYGLEDKIYLENMTDEEAVLAALVILNDIDRQREWHTALLERWAH